MNPTDSIRPQSDPAREVRVRNVRLALILASVALVLFFGFIAKMALLPHH